MIILITILIGSILTLYTILVYYIVKYKKYCIELNNCKHNYYKNANLCESMYTYLVLSKAFVDRQSAYKNNNTNNEKEDCN